ncbi:hypothetical protein As57867_012656, partial [Aphanomyces stellatus]
MAFLQLPQTKKILSAFGASNASVAAMLSDTRLDVYTNLMLQIVQAKATSWATPHADVNMTIPTEKKLLSKVKMPHTLLEVPSDDEDWPDDPPLVTQAISYIRDFAPFIDNLNATWKQGEDKEAYVMARVGKMWPKVHVVWDDRYSDFALTRFVFKGIGSHLVEKLPTAQYDGSYYGVFLNFMDKLDVR